MKLIILGDLHFGIRNDSDILFKFQKLFFETILAPYVKQHNIKHCIQLGDFFDRRQYINYKTLHNLYEFLPSLLTEIDLDMHILLGNHDVALKNSNHINSPDLLLTDIDKIHVIDDNRVIDINGFKAAMCCWINNSNYMESLDFIANAKADYLFGHFEITGFDYHKGHTCENGLNSELFSRYLQVFSGHFHTRGQRGNIQYTGTPYETSWNDWNDQKGFYVLDTDTHEIEFIKNPYNLFTKIEYYNYLDGREIVNIYPPSESVEGKYVKVICHKKEDDFVFERYTQKLFSEMPVDIQVSLTVGFEEVSPSIETTGKSISELIIENVNAASSHLYSKEVKSSTIDLLLTLQNELNAVT